MHHFKLRLLKKFAIRLIGCRLLKNVFFLFSKINIVCLKGQRYFFFLFDQRDYNFEAKGRNARQKLHDFVGIKVYFTIRFLYHYTSN